MRDGTRIDAALKSEGIAREFINKVQNMRKEQDLDVMDRIVTNYAGSPFLQRSLDAHSVFIRKETLTNDLSMVNKLEGEEWDLNGEACRIFIERTP